MESLASSSSFDPRPPAETTDLRDYVRPLWTHKWLVLFIVVISTLGTYLYTNHKPRRYKTSTSLFLQVSDLDQALEGLGGSAPVDPDRNAQNLAILLHSRAVGVEAAKKYGKGGNANTILGSVSATPSSGSDFLNITATAGSGEEAARVANAVAQAFIEVRGKVSEEKVQVAISAAQRELSNLADTPQNSLTRRSLAARIRRLQSVAALPSANAQQVESAQAPSLPFTPRPKRNAAFALVLSLLLGGGLAFLLERLDRRIKRVDSLVGAYDLPLLVEVPHVGEPTVDAEGAVELSASLREPFRSLHVNLQLASIDRPIRTLLVTSAVPGEGKSTVVRNLALAYREAGLRVAVIDSDLRSPDMATAFHVAARPGMTDVLVGNKTLEDALRTVAVTATATAPSLLAVETLANGAQNGHSKSAASAGTLAVLTSGPQPPNPPALLSAQRVRSLLAEVAASHDIVLIDSPPLLPVADTVPLVSAADGVILVARMRRTTLDATARMRELLARIPDANVLGIVANDVGKGAFRHGPGYGYGPEESSS
jgi:succinoglycan biosynthesis transport protein ExoP